MQFLFSFPLISVASDPETLRTAVSYRQCSSSEDTLETETTKNAIVVPFLFPRETHNTLATGFNLEYLFPQLSFLGMSPFPKALQPAF